MEALAASPLFPLLQTLKSWPAPSSADLRGPDEEMLEELVLCLPLAVALLGPDLRAQATKGKSCWDRQDLGGRQKGGRGQWGLRRFLRERPESGRPFWGELAELNCTASEMVKDSIC